MADVFEAEGEGETEPIISIGDYLKAVEEEELLVKNSLRAVEEKFIDSDKVAPPIRIIVDDGLEDVTIKACSFDLSSFLLSNRESVETFIFVSNQKVVLLQGIKSVSDEGGGIPRSGLPKIFTYLYSTAKNPLDEHSGIDLGTVTTMAGYGCTSNKPFIR
ncbi:[Pyruvate dehydrogenase (acetyl-transferring)] kinase [Forsythia ovata]|uniref:Protein-serine/threonine kinase n=1 Tax=Forsythia ovata TaxID=205694 RepID=A0ABD1SQB9_9LAMI